MNPSDPIGRPGKTGSLFARLKPRVFAKKDTIDLLRALVEFSSVKKRLVVYDKDDEYEFVRVRLECSPSKLQFMRKCSELRTSYLSRLSKVGGGGGGGLTGDDAVVFELSEKLWGEEAMQQLKKKKERERSGRAMTLDELRAELGLGDARPLTEGDVPVESAGLRTESELEAENSLSGKQKRKRKDESGKVRGVAENGSIHEVLNDGDGEFVELAEPSAKSWLEDEELGKKVRRKKEKKKYKVEDESMKQRRSGEEGSGSEIKSKWNDNLAIAEDLTGRVDGSSVSCHTRLERSQELNNLSERGPGNDDDDGLARLAEQGSADSHLDEEKSSRKKKKHRVDKTGPRNEEVNDVDKASKSAKSRVKSGLGEGKLARSSSEKESKPSDEEKSNLEDGSLVKLTEGNASLQPEEGKSSRKKKKKKKKKKKTNKEKIDSANTDKLASAPN